jgi:hypothetical protein
MSKAGFNAFTPSAAIRIEPMCVTSSGFLCSITTSNDELAKSNVDLGAAT